MTTTTNFKSIPLLRQWCMLTLPTVFNDALSYDEQVCKLTQAINEMATTINGLPDYIIELVKELLDQMNLEEIVKRVLADYFFINVKNPPAPLVAAKGDGVTDDTVAIQAMINYVNGKSNYLFFPAGTYSVQGLTMVPGVSLIGMDRYKTIVMLRAASNKDLLSGDLGNCTISNITLNANMPGQTANCSIYSGNATDMLISDVIFKNGYNMLSIDNDGIVQMDNVVFDGTQGNGLAIGGVRASVNNINFVNNSKLNAGTLISITGNNNSVTQILNTEYAENGVVIAGDNNVIEGWMSGTTTALSDSGTGSAINLYTGQDRVVKSINWIETDSGDKNVTIGGRLTQNVTGSEFKTLGGNYTETVTGNKGVTISGNSSETVTHSRNISAEDIVLDPTNPLTYKTPEELNSFFDYVPMKDKTGKIYDVLVYNGKPFNAGNNTMVVGYCILDKTLAGSSGECSYLKTSGNEFYIFDLGVAATFNTIKDQLVKAGCNKIKGVVLSHYDNDHVSDVALWKSNFDMTETVFYLPLATTNFPHTQTALNYIKQTFPDNTIIYPENNSSYELINSSGDNFNLEFNNCGIAVRNYYDLNTKNYNDYSMCAYVVHGDDVLAFVGDVGDVAQKYMYDNGMGRKVTTITAPHHAVNSNEGYQPLWRVWTPQFVFIPNNYEQQNLTGLRSPFVAICRLYGAKITASVENSDTVIVASTGTGVIAGNYYPTLTSWYADQMVANLYVDETYNGNIQNGNENTPFADLQRACNAATGFPTKITIVKWSKTMTLTWKENLTVDLGTNTIAYLTMNSCKNVVIQNGTINGIDLFDNTNCKLLNISSSVAIIQNRGFMYFENCTITNPVDSGFTFNNCYAVITNGSVTANKCAIHCVSSVVTGEFALKGFKANTAGARLIWISSGECFIGRQDDTTQVLKKQLWYFSATDSYKKEILFDTTENRYCYLNPSGELVYLAYKNDIPVTP